MNIATEALSLSVIQWDLIIGGLALFLFGIDYMGEGLKNVAGDKLKEYIDKYTNKTWKGIIVGILITVLIQSSSATSSIAISFVRAGLMSVPQSIGIIIGANIGTTITAFLIGLNIEELALYFVFIGVMISLFAKRKKQKYYGQIILGFGVLFFGLKLMGDELSILGDLEAFESIATQMSEIPILGMLAGTVLTAIVQSSSATVGIIQKIYDSGAITLSAALPFAFGCSIGTTITGMFASIGGSIASKRTAAMNVVFNLLGAILFMLILVPYTSFIQLLSTMFNLTPMMQIAFAHVIRAVVISILWYPFIKVLIAIGKKLIPGEEEKIEINFDMLDPKLANELPAVALDVAKQATVKMSELAINAIEDSRQFFLTKSGKFNSSSHQLEDAINTLDTKITDYLTNITHVEVGVDDIDESIINLQVVKNLERIGDIVMNLNEFYEQVFEEKEEFTEEAIEEVSEMYKIVIEMIQHSIEYFDTQNDMYIGFIINNEEKLDALSEKAKKEHFIRMRDNTCVHPVASSIYIDVVSNLERMGDHAYNVIKLISPNVPKHTTEEVTIEMLK